MPKVPLTDKEIVDISAWILDQSADDAVTPEWKKNQVETITSIAGQDMKEKKDGELNGETFFSERVEKGKWKHSLVDVKPTEKQQKELDKRTGMENADIMFPEGKTKVGHTWSVDASAIQHLVGNSISDLKGKMDMKFLKVEEVDGEMCAVIETSGTVKGVA